MLLLNVSCGYARLRLQRQDFGAPYKGAEACSWRPLVRWCPDLPTSVLVVFCFRHRRSGGSSWRCRSSRRNVESMKLSPLCLIGPS
ncbi:hypothetical protein NQZ68_040185 [Dissostichus eleginoides]|nr:hypothetical protein NQZ68_040185 [Dissostichus eleginoides]